MPGPDDIIQNTIVLIARSRAGLCVFVRVCVVSTHVLLYYGIWMCCSAVFERTVERLLASSLQCMVSEWIRNGRTTRNGMEGTTRGVGSFLRALSVLWARVRIYTCVLCCVCENCVTRRLRQRHTAKIGHNTKFQEIERERGRVEAHRTPEFVQ